MPLPNLLVPHHPPPLYIAFRQAISGEEQAEEEMELLFKVINKLIRSGNTLAVLSVPVRLDTEDEAEYVSRQQQERVLSLHANYAPDV